MYASNSSLGVRQNVLQRFKVATCSVESLLAFGEERLNECFLVEEEKGVLETRIQKGNWVYEPYDPHSNTLHPKAQMCLDEVSKAGFPIRQIIYAYEVPEVAAKPQPKPQIHIPKIQISEHTVKTVATVATAALVLTAGAAVVLGYAFLTALSAVDPKLIVVLDTGADEKELPWSCLMSWDD